MTATPSSTSTFLLPKQADLFPLAGGARPEFVSIAELRSGRTNFSVEVVVLESHERRPYMRKNRRQTDQRRGGVAAEHAVLYIFHVADRSGSIVFNVFSDHGEFIHPGDILHVRGAYARIFDETESLQLYAGPRATIQIVGQDTLVFRVMPNWSLFSWVTDPENPQSLRSIPPPEGVQLHWFPNKNRQILGHKILPGEKPGAAPSPNKVNVPPPGAGPPGSVPAASGPPPPGTTAPMDPRLRHQPAAAPTSRPGAGAAALPTDPRLRTQPANAPSGDPRFRQQNPSQPSTTPETPPPAAVVPPQSASASAPAAAANVAAVKEITWYIDALTPFFPSRNAVLDLVQSEARGNKNMNGEDIVLFLRGLLERKKAEGLARGPVVSSAVGGPGPGPGQGRSLGPSETRSYEARGDQNQSGRTSPPSRQLDDRRGRPPGQAKRPRYDKV